MIFYNISMAACW